MKRFGEYVENIFENPFLFGLFLGVLLSLDQILYIIFDWLL